MIWFAFLGKIKFSRHFAREGMRFCVCFSLGGLRSKVRCWGALADLNPAVGSGLASYFWYLYEASLMLNSAVEIALAS